MFRRPTCSDLFMLINCLNFSISQFDVFILSVLQKRNGRVGRFSIFLRRLMARLIELEIIDEVVIKVNFYDAEAIVVVYNLGLLFVM